MNRRKLLTMLAAAGVFAGGFSAAVLPASADQRTFVVTFLGGKTMTVTLDVPAGTPADQITVPGVSTPIVGVTEITPQATPVPTVPGVPAVPAVPNVPLPGPTPSGGGDSGSGSGPDSGAHAGDKPQTTDRPSTQGGQQSQTTKSHARTKGQENLVSVIEAEGGKAKLRSSDGSGRNPDGTPTIDNPAFTLALPGA